MTEFSEVLSVNQVAQPGIEPLKKNGGAKPPARSGAVEFLLGVLRDGPVAVTELDRRARSSGLVGREFIGQNKACRKARKLLGIVAFQRGRKWHWSLPQAPSCSTPDDPAGIPATSVDPPIASPAPVSGAKDIAARADTSFQRAPLDAAAAAVTRWAEGVAKLDHSRPPRGVAAHRWHAIIADFTSFLTSTWSARAANFGWTSTELFGCDLEKPPERPDRLGLCWFIRGGRVVELNRGGATISAGTSERYHQRRRAEPSAVRLPWRDGGRAAALNPLSNASQPESPLPLDQFDAVSAVQPHCGLSSG